MLALAAVTLAAATAVAAVASLSTISLHGDAQALFLHYAAVRDAAFGASPVALPDVAKDLIALYLLSGLALNRAFVFVFGGSGHWLQAAMAAVLMTLFWPVLLAPVMMSAALTLVAVGWWFYQS